MRPSREKKGKTNRVQLLASAYSRTEIRQTNTYEIDLIKILLVSRDRDCTVGRWPRPPWRLTQRLDYQRGSGGETWSDFFRASDRNCGAAGTLLATTPQGFRRPLQELCKLLIVCIDDEHIFYDCPYCLSLYRYYIIYNWIMIVSPHMLFIHVVHRQLFYWYNIFLKYLVISPRWRDYIVETFMSLRRPKPCKSNK